MSDASSVSSASSAEPTLAELLAEARQHQKAASDLLKKVAGAAKGLKAPKKKAADGEKKPRKTSDGQRRWQAFQKFIWDKLKEENPATPFKEAMKEAGPRWAVGSPIREEDQDAFEAWLEENPIPTAEEAAAAKEAKAAEAAAEKEGKKALREAIKVEKALRKAEKAKADKAAKAAAAPAKATPAKASPAAAATKAVAKVAPKPTAPATTPVKKPAAAAPTAPKKAAAPAAKIPTASKAAAKTSAKTSAKVAAAAIEDAAEEDAGMETFDFQGTSYFREGRNLYDKATLDFVGLVEEDESGIDFDAPEQK